MGFGLEWTCSGHPDPHRKLAQEAALNSFFDKRHARLRPEYAWLYPLLAPGVWILASKTAGWLSDADIVRDPSCTPGRVMSDVHFEFRGGGTEPKMWRPRGETTVKTQVCPNDDSSRSRRRLKRWWREPGGASAHPER